MLHQFVSQQRAKEPKRFQAGLLQLKFVSLQLPSECRQMDSQAFIQAGGLVGLELRGAGLQIRRHRVPRSFVDSCQIILCSADGLSGKALVAELGRVRAMRGIG